MLGSGGPFVIEIDEPRKRSIDTAAVEERINDVAGGRVEVERLRLATHDLVERVKELDASKTYQMDVEFAETVDSEAFEGALAELEGATVEQETPQRVSHRRAAKTRVRSVYEASGELNGERHATVEIHGEGGLYVKELVSSDDGRTEPSLAGLLGVDAEVTALDVLEVRGENEPFEQPELFRDDTSGDAGED